MIPHRSHRNRSHRGPAHHQANPLPFRNGSRGLLTDTARHHGRTDLGHAIRRIGTTRHHYGYHAYASYSHHRYGGHYRYRRGYDPYVYSGYCADYRGYGYGGPFYAPVTGIGLQTRESVVYLNDDRAYDNRVLGSAPAPVIVASPAPAGAALLAPLEQGDAAFAAGDYVQARRHYIRAQLDGVYAGEATLAYALTHFALGNYDLAALALRRGLDLIPDAISQPLDVTYFYPDRKLLEAHLGALEQQLERGGATGQGWLVLGYVRFGSGDSAGAVLAFERALQADPDDALAQLLREAAVAARNQRGPTSNPGAHMGPPSNRTGLLAALPGLPE
ncbi:MAG: tetratricopeptide repeat protein [Phycisphaerae bacterium]